MLTMKRFWILAASCCLFAGCSAGFDVKLSNELQVDRTDEIVEIPVVTLSENGIGDISKAIVVDRRTGKQVASQLTYDGLLIFPADVPANGSAEYRIKEGKAKEYKTRAYGRYVPERKDDVCWENDRIAFRAYGPVLENTGELISCGYDIWTKRTEEMVIDHRYYMDNSPETRAKRDSLQKSGDRQAYRAYLDSISFHIDHGDGLDYYNVGRTLGAGAMAPYTEGKLWMANNYVTYEVLDNGPLRFTCNLDYAPFDANGRTVSEHRLIRMDAGSQFCKVNVRYDEEGAEKGVREALPVAAGIIIHGTEDYVMAPEAGYVYYADPASEKDGQTYIGLLFPEGSWEAKIDCNHLLAVTEQYGAAGTDYYFGAGWSKYGFKTPEDWGRHAEAEAMKLRSPLTIEYK